MAIERLRLQLGTDLRRHRLAAARDEAAGADDLLDRGVDRARGGLRVIGLRPRDGGPGADGVFVVATEARDLGALQARRIEAGTQLLDVDRGRRLELHEGAAGELDRLVNAEPDERAHPDHEQDGR
ncbi:MAG: hypothetical protein V9E87_02340 [Gemmatimonadales bacterium]